MPPTRRTTSVPLTPRTKRVTTFSTPSGRSSTNQPSSGSRQTPSSGGSLRSQRVLPPSSPSPRRQQTIDVVDLTARNTSTTAAAASRSQTTQLPPILEGSTTVNRLAYEKENDCFLEATVKCFWCFTNNFVCRYNPTNKKGCSACEVGHHTCNVDHRGEKVSEGAVSETLPLRHSSSALSPPSFLVLDRPIRS